MTRPGWDAYFLDIAQTVATRADCRRSRVGCVLVDAQHRIISTGYNGTDPGRDGCLAGACPRGLLSYEQQAKDVGYAATGCTAYHAEHNALRFAGERLYGLVDVTAYITRKPCPDCLGRLSGRGITRVIWPAGYGYSTPNK